jgi:hypothetical protein
VTVVAHLSLLATYLPILPRDPKRQAGSLPKGAVGMHRI